MTATTPDTEPRKPIRMGEIALAMATRPHAEPTSSVRINRSVTNGRWGIEVDVTMHDAAAAYAKAVELARLAESEFPYIETPPSVGPTTKAKTDAKGKGPSNKVPF